ncbi:MAG TPA: TonB-dependent receptor [Novosphingobium sp.]|nr:TonB-dependent receptor [Novosphingobium sp.]
MNSANITKLVLRNRAALLGCCAVVALATGGQALAQEAEADSFGVTDIVVTAQKREQSMQDVPVAITAISSEALQVNRIESVMDLGAQAPNLNVRATAGGVGVPTFTMRGSVTYGSVSGQDRTIAMYLDGVYMGSAYGSAFELPDLERIEVLRGPQGTLFGRNSTAGAISIVTKDPSGDYGLRQQFTYGNYDQFRSSTRVELPQVGPFSASISYTHNERRGDVRNLGAGTVWNRDAAAPTSWQHRISQVSPEWLGGKNSESVFGALKFEPSDTFKMVYKFDWNENVFTPEANSLVAFVPAFLGAYGATVQAVLDSFPVASPGAHRPKAVSNPWTTPGLSKTKGHNLTATYVVSDSISIKNVFGYRTSGVVANSEVGGYGAILTPATAALFGFPALAGSPFTVFGTQSESHVKQWSDELQVNYDSDLLTLTAGGIYFDIESTVGQSDGLSQGVFAQPVFGGVLAGGQRNLAFFDGVSYAGYVQAEVHVTEQLDLIGGYRLTRDEKNGTSYVFVPAKAATATDPAAPARQDVYTFDYRDTRSSYMLGVNYKVTDDILAYAKYSTGYVSGGAVAKYGFDPETVKAWEAGVKADFFDRRLRANLALFKADYKDLQAVSGGRFLLTPDPDVGTLILREGDLDTKGFELELTAAPVRGLTLNAAAGYTDSKLKNVNPLLRPVGSVPTVRPKWTSNLSAQYDTQPLVGDAYLMFRVDGAWRSKSRQLGNPISMYPASFGPIITSDAMWLVNARVALRDFDLAGSKAELAVWGRNLTDSDNPGQPIDFAFAATSTYQSARTYGVDLTFEF